VGLGSGAEAEQLIRRGARVSGLDVDPAVVEHVARRLHDRDLAYDALRHGDVADLPWPDDSFDVIFSHGLLDRIDDVSRAAAEFRRVLRPGGQLVVMVRARRSWRYRVTIPALRAGLTALVPLARVGVPVPGRAGTLLAAARREGRRAAFADPVLLAVHDGADRAPRRVLGNRELAAALEGFTVSRRHQYVGPRALGPLTRWAGWHLWLHLTSER
jgi:SAM-dependent methyltransferase